MTLLNAVKTWGIGGRRQELLITPVSKGQPSITPLLIIIAFIHSFLFVYTFLQL